MRNRKIDTVDAEGNFLFHGLTVRRIEIPVDPDMANLETELAEYLRRGYRAGMSLGGSSGRAVGFVMTIYRKLASSSVAALAAALYKRKARILDREIQAATADDPQRLETSDAELFENDDSADREVDRSAAQPFFDDEVGHLERLINLCAQGVRHDPKYRQLADIVQEIVIEQKQHLLIFTEFRTTQEYLARKLEELLGRAPLVLHGGMDVDSRREAIREFEGDDRPILISTEAGGEGLNLQRRCHVLVNYDLPWNPSRISQRIGRLYRYGQKKRVVAINFHAKDTIDNEIISGLLERIEAVVHDMAHVGPEFDERYASEIMGELLERVDIAALLDEARVGVVERTKERIDAALAQAEQARRLQDEILSHAGSFDPNSWRGLGALSTNHLAKFIKRAAPFFEIEIDTQTANEERFTVRLPASLRGAFPEFANRTVLDLTTSRAASDRIPGIILIDFSTAFLQYVVAGAMALDFSGGYAATPIDDRGISFAAAFLARYQNEQGDAQGERLILVSRSGDGRVQPDASLIESIFVGKADTAPVPGSTDAEKRELYSAARDRAEIALAADLTKFRHPNDLVPLALIDYVEAEA